MNADGWTTCLAGHRHWGRAGAAGLLVHRRAATGLEALLQRRSVATQHGGTWGLPGGALHAGERPEDGALREACEELGLSPESVAIDGHHVDDHGGWSYVTVLAQPTSALDLADLRLNWECSSAAWVPVAPLADGIQLHPGLRATLPALLNLIHETELAELHSALFG